MDIASYYCYYSKCMNVNGLFEADSLELFTKDLLEIPTLRQEMEWQKNMVVGILKVYLRFLNTGHLKIVLVWAQRTLLVG